MISALFLIAEIHSTTNLKTHEHEQMKTFFNPTKTHSSSEESLMPYVFWYMSPLHLVEYANTEFMSKMT